MTKLDILAIGVHPDDVELSCSGTLLRHISMGKAVGILDLTRGELGTRGSGELRLVEATEAARILGVSVRENLGMADAFFEYDRHHIIRIIEIIRRYQPEIVLANALNDRHPDHSRAAKLVADACFYSGLAKIDTNQPRHRPRAVYHYIQDQNLVPDFVIDITPYMEQKIAAVLAFKSQFFNTEYDKPELQTPISGKDFLDFLYAKAKSYGRSIGVEYAEGFNVGRTIGVANLFDLV